MIKISNSTEDDKKIEEHFVMENLQDARTCRQSTTLNGDHGILPKPELDVFGNYLSDLNNIETQSAVKTGEANFFVEHNDDSNEIIFHCKQYKCKGFWILDKIGGRIIYSCPMCGIDNCSKCQVVHDNMTCEEYNQHSQPSEIIPRD